MYYYIYYILYKKYKKNIFFYILQKNIFLNFITIKNIIYIVIY